MSTLRSRDFAETELLRRGQPGRYETYDKRFRALRRPHRGWELVDAHGALYQCDSLEICQIRVVELRMLEYLRSLLALTDAAAMTERLTQLTNTLTRH